MKKINYILAALVLLVVALSCEKEYKEPNEFSDVSFYTSQFQRANYFLALNDYISFSDLSRGALSHKWELLDDSCYFLEGKITNNDSIYDGFIVDGTVSENPTIHVLFNHPGLKRVRLYNEFSDSVYYTGRDGITGAVRNGDVWVFDTTFVVDVYDNIVPEFKVYDMDDNEIVLNYSSDTTQWEMHQVEEGDTLRFVDMTTIGRPNERTWNFGTGQTAYTSDSVAYAIYYATGTFRGSIVSRRNSLSLPGGATFRHIPLFVEVAQSSRPFEYVSVTQQSSTLIHIQLNGSVDESSVAGEASNIMVRVKNGDFDTDITVASVQVHSTGSILEVNMTEDLYNTDTVTISFADGQILSGGGRELQYFSDVPVAMKRVNLLGYGHDFEDGGSVWTVGSDDTGLGSQSYSTTDPAQGAFCYHMAVEEDNNRISAVYPNLFTLKNGSEYVLTFKGKKISGAAGGFEFRINRGGVIDDRFIGNWTGYDTFTEGQWQDVEKVFTYNEPDAELGIQMLLYRSAEFYFDELILYENENRP